uniref:Uncharacterized protein n=1 Tax=Glossina palpalis gambiensis TaxID=67801 RepID=A0A1B0AMY7_9MUSC
MRMDIRQQKYRLISSEAASCKRLNALPLYSAIVESSAMSFLISDKISSSSLLGKSDISKMPCSISSFFKRFSIPIQLRNIVNDLKLIGAVAWVFSLLLLLFSATISVEFGISCSSIRAETKRCVNGPVMQSSTRLSALFNISVEPAYNKAPPKAKTCSEYHFLVKLPFVNVLDSAHVNRYHTPILKFYNARQHWIIKFPILIEHYPNLRRPNNLPKNVIKIRVDNHTHIPHILLLRFEEEWKGEQSFHGVNKLFAHVEAPVSGSIILAGMGLSASNLATLAWKSRRRPGAFGSLERGSKTMFYFSGLNVDNTHPILDELISAKMFECPVYKKEKKNTFPCISGKWKINVMKTLTFVKQISSINIMLIGKHDWPLKVNQIFFQIIFENYPAFSNFCKKLDLAK